MHGRPDKCCIKRECLLKKLDLDFHMCYSHLFETVNDMMFRFLLYVCIMDCLELFPLSVFTSLKKDTLLHPEPFGATPTLCRLTARRVEKKHMFGCLALWYLLT